MAVQLWLPFPRLEEPRDRKEPWRRRRWGSPTPLPQLPMMYDYSLLYFRRPSPCRAELER